MVSSGHVHDALRQVRELKRRVIESQQFTGYSGRVRAIGGTFALVAALVMSRPGYPTTVRAHLIGWAVVLAVALAAHNAPIAVLLRARGRPQVPHAAA